MSIAAQGRYRRPEIRNMKTFIRLKEEKTIKDKRIRLQNISKTQEKEDVRMYAARPKENVGLRTTT